MFLNIHSQEAEKCSLNWPSASKLGVLVGRTLKGTKHWVQPGLEHWTWGWNKQTEVP